MGKTVQDRADAVWEEAGLKRITLHEGRHTFASLMIAAGVNAKALSTFMDHASISITLDRYGHLMPGSERRLPSFWTATCKPSRIVPRGRLGAAGGVHAERLTGERTGEQSAWRSPKPHRQAV